MIQSMSTGIIISSFSMVFFFACKTNEIEECSYKYLESFVEESKVKDGSKMAGTIKMEANFKKLGATTAEIQLVDTTFLKLKDVITKRESIYETKFIQKHNAAVHVLCALDREYENETDSIKRDLLFMEKMQKRTEYFNYFLKGEILQNLEEVPENTPVNTPIEEKILSTPDKDGTNKVPKKVVKRNHKEDDSDLIIITPYKYGETKITSLSRNSGQININNSGSSVPLGVRKGDLIIITFSSGKTKEIVYDGTNL